MAIWEGVCRYVCVCGTCSVHVERGGGAVGRKCGVMNYMCVDSFGGTRHASGSGDGVRTAPSTLLYPTTVDGADAGLGRCAKTVALSTRQFVVLALILTVAHWLVRLLASRIRSLHRTIVWKTPGSNSTPGRAANKGRSQTSVYRRSIYFSRITVLFISLIIVNFEIYPDIISPVQP